MNKKIEGLTNIKNLLPTYVLSKIFNLQVVSNQSLSLIKCFFTTIVETRNFLELDYAFVAKILASSALYITSEVEVYRSGHAWLRHKIHDRKDYAKRLLLKVRLSLLTNDALKYILNEPSSFTENGDCVALISGVLKNVEKLKEPQAGLSYNHRYCHHGSFSFIVCGGFKKNTNADDIFAKTVDVVSSSTLKHLKRLADLKRGRRNCNAVRIKDEVYVIGGEIITGVFNERILIRSVDRYSFKTKKWKKITDVVDERNSYSATAFMDKIFLLGGKIRGRPCNSCLEYDTKNCKWKICADMNEQRSSTASAVFEERIVVCGGKGIVSEPLNTVASFDVFANKWWPMPSMVYTKIHHDVVVVRNKLYVVNHGYNRSEVYDSVSKKFNCLKFDRYIGSGIKAVAIGCKIFIFHRYIKVVLCYDVNENEWSADYFYYDKTNYSCVKIPWF